MSKNNEIIKIIATNELVIKIMRYLKKLYPTCKFYVIKEDTPSSNNCIELLCDFEEADHDLLDDLVQPFLPGYTSERAHLHEYPVCVSPSITFDEKYLLDITPILEVLYDV